MSRSPWSRNKNFFHHCNLSGHWEAKCWQIHPELHPRHHIARRWVWRVNIEEDEDIHASLVQVIEFFQGDITTQGTNKTKEEENRLMLRETII